MTFLTLVEDTGPYARRGIPRVYPFTNEAMLETPKAPDVKGILCSDNSSHGILSFIAVYFTKCRIKFVNY